MYELFQDCRGVLSDRHGDVCHRKGPRSNAKQRLLVKTRKRCGRRRRRMRALSRTSKADVSLGRNLQFTAPALLIKFDDLLMEMEGRIGVGRLPLSERKVAANNRPQSLLLPFRVVDERTTTRYACFDILLCFWKFAEGARR